MGWYHKFCEWGTDARFVPHGKKCDLCGKKLAYLDTGFWSINAKWLSNGVICRQCHKKLQLLAEYRNSWIPKALRMSPPFCAVCKQTPHILNVQEAQTVFEAAETFALKELSSVAPDCRALFRMQNACFIKPTALQVGIKRAKQLNNKLVLFGFVQSGRFKKDDHVIILDGGTGRETTVLEAYTYDPDVPENDLEVNLKAHTGKQQMAQWQTGWLVLDDENSVSSNTSVCGQRQFP